MSEAPAPEPASAQKAAPSAAPGLLRAWGAGAAAAAFAELLLAVLAHERLGLGGVLLVVSLWTLTGLVAAWGVRALAALVWPGGALAFRRAVRDAWQSDDGTSPSASKSRVASAGLLGGVVAGVTMAGLLGALAYLVVENAHSHALMAIALGLASPLVGGLALGLGSALRRRLLKRTSPLPTFRTWLSLAGLTLLVAVSLALALRLETLQLLGAHTLMLPGGAFLVALVVFVASSDRADKAGPMRPLRPRHPARASLILTLVASLLLVLGWRLPRARGFVARGTWTSRYLLAGVQELTDLDRDGVASFPLGSDCAAFDASRHPLAREIPDNGVDENCDGLDSLPSVETSAGATQPLAPLTGEQPDLFLVTVDALRADHVGFMGYRAQPTTPDLDPIAEGGVIFERAYSQDSGTAPSMWSLMAGKTPFQVALLETPFPPNFADSETTLAEHLKAAGYETHALLCGSLFDPGPWNIRRGFDEFEEICHRRPRDMGPIVRDRALPLVDPAPDAALTAGERPPRFVWLHFFDPHHPYVDHEAWHFGNRSIDHYDEEIRHVQEFVADTIRRALDEGHHRPRFVVLSADHGENFQEHGRDPHARTLYREVTHVPLVVLGTDLEARRVAEPVALGDVYPTLLNLAGVATPHSSTMESLVPTLLGGLPSPERAIFQENSWSRPTHHVKGMILGRFHMIRDLTDDTTELYDMLADPRELVDLFDTGLAEQADLQARMNAFIATTHIPEAYR